MLKKFLKEVVVLIASKQAEEIVDLLDTKKHINEFTIAKKLDLTINQTRNILYKISDQGLVSFIRKKDKRKGWYTYFWKIEILKSLEFLKENILKKINQLEGQIKSRETKRFYVCERCHIELSEENALLYDFTCNECGALFVVKDNQKMLRELKKSLGALNKDLGFVQAEIDKEREKLDKEKIKEQKKIEKSIKKKKLFKKAERLKEKNKAIKEKKKGLKEKKPFKTKTKVSLRKKVSAKLKKSKKVKKPSKKKIVKRKRL